MGGDAAVQVDLPPPAGAVDLLVIAGEHSGDQHAARAVTALRAKHPQVNIAAIGGPALREAGAQLLFDLTDHSVVGIVEVARHYGFFRRLFYRTVEWIEQHQPKLICLVDYPGFNLRLAAELKRRGISRQGGGSVAVFQYISPQIWAWKAKRRFKMQQILDEVGTIFPFEVDCYRDTRLPAFFLGHPFASSGYRMSVSYQADGPVLCLPGSRRAAVSRIFPRMLEVCQSAEEALEGRRLLVLYPSLFIRDVLTEVLRDHPWRERVDCVPVEQGGAGAAVLASAGTMSLQCALAGIPGAILYLAHPMTYWIGKRLVKISYLGMANILLERTLYPEFIQGDATPPRVATVLQEALANPQARQLALSGAEELRAILSKNRYKDPDEWLADGIGLRASF